MRGVVWIGNKSAFLAIHQTILCRNSSSWTPSHAKKITVTDEILHTQASITMYVHNQVEFIDFSRKMVHCIERFLFDKSKPFHVVYSFKEDFRIGKNQSLGLRWISLGNDRALGYPWPSEILSLSFAS